MTEKKVKNCLEKEKNIGNLEAISDFIQEKCMEENLSSKKTWELMLVVDEICSKIISGNLENKNKIKIAWYGSEKYITIKIQDSGERFNPLLPGSDEDEKYTLGAMSTRLIEKMVDEACYERYNNTNKVTIKKFLKYKKHGREKGKTNKASEK
jgi:anti-sigma regulatory factor (Ser/Thr protein kinase)